MRKELIIIGHPHNKSLCWSLAHSYKEGAEKSGKKVDILDLGALEFDPILKYGYQKRMDLEPDLIQAQEMIKAADHLVWFFPVWWSVYPALMKGFLDRTFIPGFGYRPNGRPLPEKLLKGKTADLYVTMDSPVWYFKTIAGKPGVKAMIQGTLSFCGIKTKRVKYFTPVKGSSEEKRKIWIDRVFKAGSGQ